MLYHTMRSLAHIAGLMACSALHAQVELSAPLLFTGTTDQRQVEGLGTPISGTSAITVEFATLGAGHWCQAQLVTDSLVLSIEPAVTSLQDGLLLRFQNPSARFGPTWIKVVGHSAKRLLRRDGLDPVRAELESGAVCEVVFQGDRFILTSPPVTGCPSNAVPVNANYCIQTGRRTTVTHPEATQFCAQLGGRLCTWDEYYVACTLVGNQLTGRFVDWEWINDTSDHTHTGNQMGRTNCNSLRTMIPSTVNSVRCCFNRR